MIADTPYVRLIEHVFVANLTAKSFASGEWRYAWTEQRFHVGTGAYADASPARSGTVSLGYVTELRGSELAVPGLYWCRLKGSVGQVNCYEVVGTYGGGSTTYSSYTPTIWATTQNNYDPPDNVTILRVSSSSTISLTGIVLEDNRIVTLRNVGSYPILLPHQSTSSTAENRILTQTGETIVLAPTETVTLWHDPTTDRNVILGTTTALEYPAQTSTITTQQNDFPLTPGVPEVVFTLTSSDLDLTGITPPSTTTTTELRITNSPSSTFTLSLPPEDTDSASTARFRTPASTTPAVRLPPGTSVVVRYDPSIPRWIVPVTDLPHPWSPTLTGTNNDLAIPVGGFPALIPTLSAATTITGLAGLTTGATFVVMNPRGSSYDLTLAHDGSGSTSTNRFDLSGAADLVLSPGEGGLFVYDGSRIVDAGTSTTLASSSSPATPGWTKVTKTYTDLSTAATTNTITLVALAAKQFVDKVVIKHSTAFSGGGLISYSLDVGITGTTGYFITAFDGFQAVSDTAKSEGDIDYSTFGGTNATITANCAGANLDQATAGSVDVWLLISTLP